MSLNKVMLIGNVGMDPEVHYVDSGVCTARIRLATSTPGYTLPGGTQVPEQTEWHNILLWRRNAEVAERYVHKGDKLYIEGQLRSREYTDRQGHSRRVTEIWGDKIELLTPRPRPAVGEAPSPAPSAGNPGADGTGKAGTADSGLERCPF